MVASVAVRVPQNISARAYIYDPHRWQIRDLPDGLAAGPPDSRRKWTQVKEERHGEDD
jgi:hypothetical protein